MNNSIILRTNRVLFLLLAALFMSANSLFAQSVNTYEYDNLNRLTKTTYANGVIVQYTYDAVGNRLTKTVAGIDISRTINATANPTNGGTVSGGGTYYEGTSCTLTATANEGFIFQNWTCNGIVVATTPTYTFTVTGDASFVANFGQGILIGDEGTETNKFLPSYSYYNYSLTQQIYTVNEIGMSGQINSVAFYNDGATKTRDYAVYMVHTDKTSFGNTTDWISVTANDLVFSGTVTMEEGIWTTFVLNSPFTFNGSSNLAIIVDDNSGNYTGSPHMQCRVFNADGNQAIRVYSDNTNYDPTNPSGYSGTLLSVKNQIMLGMENSSSSFVISASANPSNGGTVIGSGTYQQGQSCSLTATANSGYTFTNWTENGSVVSTEATYSFVVNGGRTLVANFTAANPPTPEENLVAYYPFDGDVNDYSGNGNHGTIIGNVIPAPDRHGNPNGAYRFPGEAFNYISVPDAECLHLNSFTLSAWVYTDADNYGSGTLVNKGRDINNGSYRLYVRGVGASTLYGGTNDASVEEEPSVGQWHMVTGTVEGDQARYYLDGVLMAEATLSHPFSYNNTEPLTLGCHYYNGVPSIWAYTLLGVLDEVRIYNRALSQQEVGALYGNNDDLIAYYPFNGDANDYSGNGYHATPCNNYQYEGGVAGECIAVEGQGYMTSSGGHVLLPQYDFSNASGITLSLWVKALGLTSDGESYINFGCDDDSERLYIMQGSNEIRFAYHDAQISIPYESSYTGNWVMYTLSCGYEGKLRAYVDGSLVGEQNVNYNGYINTSLAALARHWWYSGSATSTRFIGSFDEVRIYSRVLSPAEVQMLYGNDAIEITATANPSEGGTVSGAGIYNHGDTCTVTATANSGYTFTNWTENGNVVSNNANYTFTVTANRNLVANFAASSSDYHWAVNINQYPNTMTCVGIIQINGVEQMTNTLELGAFCNNECRGREKPYYVSQLNRYVLFITLYGNDGDMLNFRLYDHAIGQELGLSCATIVSFATNNVLGTAANPYVFNFTDAQSQAIELSEGWTWWSSYVEAADLIDQLETGLGTHGQTIKSQNGFVQYSPEYNIWYGSIGFNVNNESCYMIQTNSPCQMEVSGNLATPSNHPITISNGWNWIGYPCASHLSFSSAFSNITPSDNDQVKSQSHGFATYLSAYNVWFGTLQDYGIDPGMGLMYKSNNANTFTLVYPNGRSDDMSGHHFAANNHWTADYNAYPNNMTVTAVVELDDVELQGDNYELAAFANGECRGSVKLMHVAPLNRYIAFLTIAGDDASKLRFNLYNAETGTIETQCLTSLQYETNATIGDLESPYVIRFRSTTGMNEFDRKLHVFPNPVAHGEDISLGLTEDELGKVRVEVVNALGMVVETYQGATIRTITAPNVAGIYTLRITMQDNGTCHRKLVVR